MGTQQGNRIARNLFSIWRWVQYSVKNPSIEQPTRAVEEYYIGWYNYNYWAEDNGGK